MGYRSLEICAGAGGQALGLEFAGFEHIAVIEYEKDYCDSLKRNRPKWNVLCQDVRTFDGSFLHGNIDLLSGGVPCPPFSIAGRQLGNEDDRDLFPEMLRLAKEINPRTIMIENVKGLLSPKFDAYRSSILNKLSELGYNTHIALLNAADFGVPQNRMRVIIVGIRRDMTDVFEFPETLFAGRVSVGETIYDLMAQNDWKYVEQWRKIANKLSPTIVGGSKKHGGPDLGPTRARKAWAEMGIDGRGVADEAPRDDFAGMPRLTPRMLARIQGFPDEWDFGNRKTLACRMIGNAFPPPVAKAVGIEIKNVLDYEGRHKRSKRAVPRGAAVERDPYYRQ